MEQPQIIPDGKQAMATGSAQFSSFYPFPWAVTIYPTRCSPQVLFAQSNNKLELSNSADDAF